MAKNFSNNTISNHDRDLGWTRLWIEILQMTIDDIAWGIGNSHVNKISLSQLEQGNLTEKTMQKRLDCFESIRYMRSDDMQILLSLIGQGVKRDVSIDWVMRTVHKRAKNYRVKRGGKTVFGKKKEGEHRGQMIERKILEILKSKPGLTAREITLKLNLDLSEDLGHETIRDYIKNMKDKNMIKHHGKNQCALTWQVSN